MTTPHYLDHHSTTPCHPDVVAAMLPYLSDIFGNPAAITHEHGRRAAKALEDARIRVADYLHVSREEIYFTSGATESNNLAIAGRGVAAGDHVITSKLEHKSVLEPVAHLGSSGAAVTFLHPDGEGFLDPQELTRAISSRTRFVTVIAASGEIGTLQPLEQLAAICSERRVPLHVDATQAVGKVDFPWSHSGISTLSFSAHKFYGPKGVGVLVLRRGQRLEAQLRGGGQERKLRSGTVNVAGAVGLARALEIRVEEAAAEAERLTALRNELWEEILRRIPDTSVHGPRALRLPGNLNVSFRGVDSETLMHAMRRFSLSSGAACSSAERNSSPALEAIGCNNEDAMSSIRFGLGRSTNKEVIEALLTDLIETVPRLRSIAG